MSLVETLDRLAFNDQGLIPVITQDAQTGEVLMLAWMNRNALELTLSTGQMTYFSRSRNALWIKGETSGNYQRVQDIHLDCDGDAILARVWQEGSACHTRRKSCFYLEVNTARGLVTVKGDAGVISNTKVDLDEL